MQKSSCAATGGILIMLFLVAGSARVVHADTYAYQDRITFQWTPASGCVNRYEFYVSENGRPYAMVSNSISPNGTRPVRYVLSVRDGRVYQVRVRAVCASSGPGPASDPSERVTVSLRRTAASTAASWMPAAGDLTRSLDPSGGGNVAGEAALDVFSDPLESFQGTDPWELDSDQDGVADQAEAVEGSDPLDPADQVPIAQAGPDLRRNPYTAVVLDGSGSWDPNGDPLSFLWVQETGPAVELVGADQAVCRFQASEPGEYVFSLVVSDGRVSSKPDEARVRIRFGDSQPVADAGRDFLAPLEGPVILDGSGSYDPNGMPIGFSWKQVSGPGPVSLEAAGTASPRFLAPSLGRYVFEMNVSNGWAESVPDTVSVQVVDKLCLGDIHPRGLPDGVLGLGDGILIWLFLLNLLDLTPEELFQLDAGPMEIVDGDQSPAWIRVQPDGILDDSDWQVLRGIFNGSYRAIGWESGPE